MACTPKSTREPQELGVDYWADDGAIGTYPNYFLFADDSSNEIRQRRGFAVTSVALSLSEVSPVPASKMTAGPGAFPVQFKNILCVPTSTRCDAWLFCDMSCKGAPAVSRQAMSNKEAIRSILKTLDTTGHSFALSQSNQPTTLTVNRRNSRAGWFPIDSLWMTGNSDPTAATSLDH